MPFFHARDASSPTRIIIQIRPTELNDLHIDPKTMPGNGHCQASFYLLADLSQLETKHRRQGITNPLIIRLSVINPHHTTTHCEICTLIRHQAASPVPMRSKDAQMHRCKLSKCLCLSVALYIGGLVYPPPSCVPSASDALR